MKRAPAWVLLLAGAAFLLGAAPREADPRPLLRRTLGPFGALMASGQWVRFTMHVHRGEDEQAWRAARRALEWDPLPAAGWIHLAEHLWFRRGSAERIPEPNERASWFVAGLEVLDEGIRVSADPSEVALVKARMLGLYLLPLVEDGAVGWPGGVRDVEERTRAALAEALRLGADPRAAIPTQDPLEDPHAGHDHD